MPQSYLVFEIHRILINVIAETRPVVMVFMFLNSVALKNVVELGKDMVSPQNAF